MYVDPAMVEVLVNEGSISVRSHPDDPGLKIYNYTKKAQYEKLWNHTTKRCRGLIAKGPYIMSRPFKKFFNLGELDSYETRVVHENDDLIFSEKMDGSLGILYQAPDGRPAIATRGSFTSTQAVAGTEILREKYADFVPEFGCTYLFEIILPENKIVVDYGETRDLVLICVIDNETGRESEPCFFDGGWTGPSAEVLGASTLAEAQELMGRENTEGLVGRLANSDFRFKMKEDEYVRVHRLVHGLNEKKIWEYWAVLTMLVADPRASSSQIARAVKLDEEKVEVVLGLHEKSPGATVVDLIAGSLPDEFEEWVTEVSGGIGDTLADIYRSVIYDYRRCEEGSDGGTRADFAHFNKESDHPSMVFALLDKDYWKLWSSMVAEVKKCLN